MKMTQHPQALFLAFFLLFFPQICFATVSLSVNPIDGSNALRFRPAVGGIEDRKEIRIRINSTNGDRYQVFQRLMEPMVNEKGETLDIQSMQTATVSNSNGSGTLYMQNIDRMSMGEQLLYTSGQNGDSDSFVVVYAVDTAVVNRSGNFGGRVIFTVRGMGESFQEQTSVNIVVESPSTWKTEVAGGHNRSRIRVKDTDVSDQTADFVRVSFSGSNQQEVRVYQEVESLPQDAKANEMSADVLQFSVGANHEQGVRAAGISSLTRTSVLLYSGRDQDNDMVVRFFVNPEKAALQDSGTYLGKVKYIVETDQGREEFQIDIECDVQPVFTVDVTLPPEGVSFKNVLPNAPALVQEVQVTVRSNLHRPYQVLQDMQAPMTNEKGQELKKEYFSVKVEMPVGAKGKTRFMDFTPMEVGEYPVFSSNNEGSPVTFKVLYQLQGYPQMSGGNFAAPIRFSLNQN